MAVITGRPDVPEGLFDRVLSLLELVERLAPMSEEEVECCSAV